MQLVSKPEGQQRILDFDIENRPLSYLGMDFTTSDVTAIAASFLDEKKVHVWLLGEDSTEEMLMGFKELYDQADVVTGHYIRMHDLPIINGALMEFKLPLLDPIYASDTKIDLIRKKGISSSQESLAGMYDLPESKYHMSQTAWRLANRLAPEGIALTKKRVVDDVVQHKALRASLIEANALGEPTLWEP